MPDHSRIRSAEDLIRDGLRPTGEVAGAWRRGMMHAVERVDLVLRQKLPTRAMLDAIRSELDAVQRFCGDHTPTSYQDAFRLSEDELQRRIERHKDAAA